MRAPARSTASRTKTASADQWRRRLLVAAAAASLLTVTAGVTTASAAGVSALGATSGAADQAAPASGLHAAIAKSSGGAATSGASAGSTAADAAGAGASKAARASKAADAAPLTLPVTIVNDKTCTVTITSLEGDATSGYTAGVEVVNHADVRLDVTMSNASLNGWMCDPYFSTTVAAGKTAVDKLEWDAWSLADLPEVAQGDVDEVAFTVTARDADDWSADPLAEESVDLFPLGKDAVVDHAYQPAPTDVVVTDDKNVSYVITGVTGDAASGITMTGYVHNASSKPLSVSTDRESLDGLMCDASMYCVVDAGRSAVADLTWYADDLAILAQDAGLTEPTDIAFDLVLTDQKAFDEVDRQTYEVYPQGEAAAVTRTHTPQREDVPVISVPGCTVTAIGTVQDDYEFGVVLYVTNETDGTILIDVDDAAVNDIMCDAYCYEEVAAGKSAYVIATWYLDDLKEIGVTDPDTDVTAMSMTVTASDADDWRADDIGVGEVDLTRGASA